MLVENRFDTGEVVLNYAEGLNNGPSAILLHGFTSNWTRFESLFPELLSKLHIYGIDFRGHGKSGRTPNNYRFNDYYRDIKKFIQEKVAEPPIFITHSLGGAIAIMYAANHPNNTKALILLDPPMNFNYSMINYVNQRHDNWVTFKRIAGMDVDLESLAQEIGKIEMKTSEGRIPYSQVLSPSELVSWAELLGADDPDIFTMRIQSLDNPEVFKEYSMGYDSDVLLPKLNCPVCLLRANPLLGGIIPDEEWVNVKSMVKNLDYVFFEAIGHTMHLTNPIPIQREITRFFSSL